MRRRLVFVGAALLAALVAALLAVVVNLGVLGAIGDVKGPGHLGAMNFSSPASSEPTPTLSPTPSGRSDVGPGIPDATGQVIPTGGAGVASSNWSSTTTVAPSPSTSTTPGTGPDDRAPGSDQNQERDD